MSLRSNPVLALVPFLALVLVDATEIAAQRLPLRPPSVGGHPIVPISEGWWDNGDGSITASFGYVNRNDGPIEVPIGEGNSITPASLGGMQPTTFLTGRHHGVFTVTVPANMRETGALWTIVANGQETSAPGRPASTAYLLDHLPRPHGTVSPLIRFEEGGEVGQHPPGIVSSRMETVRVGELLNLAVHTEDISVRDPLDYRFGEPADITVTWFKHQGPPGEIEWVRHPSTPVEPPDTTATTAAPGGRPPTPPPANEVEVSGPRGTALIQARFPVAGDYMLRVRSDQWSHVPDSSGGNQCCWTNGYVRVRVTP